MGSVKLYRRRIIPAECIFLRDDQILYQDKEVIVTRWHTLRPKKTLHHGYSCYFPDRGFKVSKFYDHDGQLISWYCDIISYSHEHNQEEDSDTFVFTDLLVDVIIYPDGAVRVVDLDEMADALRDGKMSAEQLQAALRHLDKLLSIIYAGHFDRLEQYVNEYETADTAWAYVETEPLK